MKPALIFKKPATIGLILSVIMILTSGCSNKYGWYDKSYKFQPTVVERAKTRADGKMYKITDKDVVELANDVKLALRSRMNGARFARTITSTIQVMTAAVAAALTSGETAITILAGTSAVIPELQSIFGARERSKAYFQGASLIEEAEADYYLQLATSHNLISDQGITTAGAEFYSEVIHSLKLVELALIQQIPTVEDVKAAQGLTYGNRVKLHPMSMKVSLSGDEKKSFIIGDEKVLEASSADDSVATAELSDDKKSVIIKPVGHGTTTIVVLNEKGNTGSILVTAYEALSVKLVNQEVKVGESTDIIVTTKSGLKINPVLENDNAELGSSPIKAGDKTTYKVTGKKAGTVDITFKNNAGGEKTVTLSVVKAPAP